MVDISLGTGEIGKAKAAKRAEQARELRALRNTVHRLRQAADEARAELVALCARQAAERRPLAEQLSSCMRGLREAEANLEQLAIEIHSKTGLRQPIAGVRVVKDLVWEFPVELATAWAAEHGIALRPPVLDRLQFISIMRKCPSLRPAWMYKRLVLRVQTDFDLGTVVAAEDQLP